MRRSEWSDGMDMNPNGSWAETMVRLFGHPVDSLLLRPEVLARAICRLNGSGSLSAACIS